MNHAWTEPRSWPELAEGEAHVWLAHLPSARPELTGLTAVLAPEEADRARRFRFDAHRERWQLSRGILRSLLAAYLDVEPRDIAFQEGAHGKPALARPLRGLHFNASHSGDYAAFALTRRGDIGVDTEQVCDRMRGDEIARRYFAPGERRHLESLPEQARPRAFFDCWTRKEAFVKARGDGLFSGLDRFEVSLGEPRVISVPDGDPANWWMAALPEIEGYAGAVVVNAPSCLPRFWKWAPRWLRS